MFITSCSGKNHCGNIRNCERCARARQAKIANAAQLLEQQHGQLTLTVLVPTINTQPEINRLRASFLRRAVSPSGIWTVESGTLFNGLHLNVLSPKPALARWHNASTYSELVRTTSRDAAAYISKRSGMPPIEQYTGNLYGAFGQLYTYLINNKSHPTVQAAAIELTMSGNKPNTPTPETNHMTSTPTNDPSNWIRRDDLKSHHRPPSYYPNAPELSNPPYHRRVKPLAERKEIMRKHLPNLYAAAPGFSKKNQPPATATGAARSLQDDQADILERMAGREGK